MQLLNPSPIPTSSNSKTSSARAQLTSTISHRHAYSSRMMIDGRLWMCRVYLYVRRTVSECLSLVAGYLASECSSSVGRHCAEGQGRVGEAVGITPTCWCKVPTLVCYIQFSSTVSSSPPPLYSNCIHQPYRKMRASSYYGRKKSLEPHETPLIIRHVHPR